jgi:hypothetical protein
LKVCSSNCVARAEAAVRQLDEGRGLDLVDLIAARRHAAGRASLLRAVRTRLHGYETT